MDLKIAQINAQRSAAAAANLEKLICEHKVDLLCIQEPYTFKGLVRGFTAQNMTIVQPGVDKPWVAVVVANERLEIFHLAQYDSPHVICLQVMSEQEDFYIINVYCQWMLPIAPFMDHIENIVNNLRSANYIILMDTNAKSKLWFANETDERGRVVEDFLVENELHVINTPSNIPTFFTTNGQSNIDITIASVSMCKMCTNWKVTDVCTTSDHNLITFDLRAGKTVTRKFIKQESYNIKKANWENFYQQLEARFTLENIKEIKYKDPNIAVTFFDKLLRDCCNNAIPKKSASNKALPWWSETLEHLRRKANLAKKQFARAIKLHLVEYMEDAKLRYKKLRNKYVTAINKAKKESWQNFVKTEANKDPWSIPYKIVRDKIKKHEAMSSLIVDGGFSTNTWAESVQALISKCVPRNDESTETMEHKAIKHYTRRYINSNLECDITHEEINVAIKKLRRNTAPGHDGFQSEIIKETWDKAPLVIHNILNNCMRNCVFPDLWKKSLLKVILKSKSRNKQLLGSYRPISLLPTISKVYERIILQRIQSTYEDSGLSSPKQHGFRAGRSTEDAILYLKEYIALTPKKYVVALFIDIQGAFDNLWWPAIMHRLVQANCSTHLIKIVNSYFKKRNVIVRSKFGDIRSQMERGCPQGSVLGPAAWNWCMDALLENLCESTGQNGVDAVAYADDVTILLGANSRKDMENVACRVSEIVSGWCSLHKLKIAVDKTSAMTVKGKFSKNRNPTIRINGATVKFTSQVKYLGVILDEKLSFVEHAKYIRNKLLSFIMAIKRIANQEWGIKNHSKRVLYNMVAIPIASYAAAAWFERVGHKHVQRHLLAIQRSLLLLLTRAARTTSTAAMQVIAGVAPLDLIVVEKGLKSLVRRNISVTWNSYQFDSRDSQRDLDLHVEYDKILAVIKSVWQNRWTHEKHGRQLFNFIKDVDFVACREWFQPSRQLTYILTGYGSIRGTLFSRGLEDNGRCPVCDKDVETVEHMIFDCEGYQLDRFQGLEKYKNSLQKLIENKDTYIKFQKCINEMYKTRDRYTVEQHQQ